MRKCSDPMLLSFKYWCQRELWKYWGIPRRISIAVLILVSLLVVNLEIAPKVKSTLVPSWFAADQCLSIAISELVYGLNGNVGYNRVFQAISAVPGGGDFGASISDFNNGLVIASSLSDFKSAGTHHSIGTGTGRGLTLFIKTAFVLFGYQAQSLYYLYIFLLSLSVVSFVFIYRNSFIPLYICLLFLIFFYFAVTTPVVRFQSIVQVNFFPLLTVLPACFISFLIAEKRTPSPMLIIFTVVNAATLLFSFYVRSTSRYHLMYFSALFILIGIYFYRNKGLNTKWTSDFIRLTWPLSILFSLFLCLLVYINLSASKSGVEREGVYPIWHQMYLGLAWHPDAKDKFDIDVATKDLIGIKAFVRSEAGRGNHVDVNAGVKAVMEGAAPDDLKKLMFGRYYEKVIREEYLKILIKDPIFIAESFYYKLLNYYASFMLHIKSHSENIISWIVALVGVIAIFVRTALLEKIKAKEIKNYFFLLAFNFIFSMIPPVIAYSSTRTILDSMVLLTMTGTLIVSIVMAYTFKVSVIILNKFRES